MRATIYVLLTIIISCAAEPICQTYPNYNTRAYTYIVCNGTNAIDLNSSRQFCVDYTDGEADVITFPNYDEYSFIISKLNETVDKTKFRYFPGFFQKAKEDKWNPETGDFYWIDAPDTKITADSPTYWQPYRQFITDFENVAFSVQQVGTFPLDLDGVWYSGEPITRKGKSQTDINGNVICAKKGVVIVSTMGTATSPVVGKFEYWIVITVTAVVVVFGVLFAAIACCIIKKARRRKQRMQAFQKVPQNDNHVTQKVTV